MTKKIYNTPEALLAADAIRSENEYSLLYETLKKYFIAGAAFTQGPAFVTGLCESARISLASALLSEEDLYPEAAKSNTAVILVPDEKAAYRTAGLLLRFIPDVAVFPARDLVFHNIAASSHEWEYERLRILRAIVGRKLKIIVTVPEAALMFLPPKNTLEETLTVKIGDAIPTDQLLSTLSRYGYIRTDTVEGKGQFSRRGDILDVFSPNEDNPFRLEFFGDELDAAGYFDILTQRRTENVREFTITPTREIMLNDGMRETINDTIDTLISAAKRRKVKDSDITLGTKETLIDKLMREKDSLMHSELNSIDKYIPLLFEKKVCLLDYADGPCFLFDYPRIKERLKAASWQMNETILDLIQSGELSAKNTTYSFDFEDLKSKLTHRPSMIADSFTSNPDMEISGLFHFSTKQTAPFTQSFEVLCDDLIHYNDSNYRTILLSQNMRAASSLAELLTEKNIKCVLLGGTEKNIEGLTPGYAYILPQSTIDKALTLSGFELSRTRFSLLTETSSEYAAEKKRGRRSGENLSNRKKILSYTDLADGDYVVHTIHGIGRYMGIKTLTVDTVTKDYITIQYAGTDILYVPTDQMDKVSKYSGGGENVKLSKMGGGEWQKTKTRVKKAAKDMAKQLIALYAERQKRPGYSFAADTEWQKDFEERFEYEETAGQTESIADIKADMEKQYPMDRLLCGDVGFGKTEVALRAVFKCIMEGKQAAILVPTTILAWQHFQTVLSRMHGFPIKSEMLSRFRSAKQAKEILLRLKNGDIDVIIGTHKLLQKDVEFKDLGLLIIDEEQRFGVGHKERLKEIARQVDVLTLTATPIPRTFNMALVGIRDMSVLDEAPQDRYPVQTYVLEHDALIVGEAIKKELRRGGQVFYLYNRVEGIERVAAQLREMAPEAEIACAHGKMPQEMLSEIWKDLVDGKIDVLVCTTIIETGVDVPNANTLIIEDADRLGLSQLHQIRGRVGRSNRKAYAYFTWKPDGTLTEIAQKRLEAIREFTEFGSGFKIAMRDLEIRGAGNLLGAEQSGQMESVGYDLYVKILEEAILEEKGIAPITKKECTIDLRLDAYIPEKYIRLPAGRIEMYKKIAAIENKSFADEITDELLDRYGDPPRSVKNLIDISLARVTGAALCIKKIEQRENKLHLYPEKIDNDISMKLVSKYRGRILLSMGQSPCYNIKLNKDESAMSVLTEIFKIYTQNEENISI